MKPPAQPKVRKTLDLPAALGARLQRVAERLGVTETQIVCDALEQALARLEKESHARVTKIP